MEEDHPYQISKYIKASVIQLLSTGTRKDRPVEQ